MKLRSATFSRQGPRSSNQDRVLGPILTRSGSWVAAIADGVGGAPGGGEAAQIAIDAAAKTTGDAEMLAAIFDEAVTEIRTVCAQSDHFQKMATTLSLVLIKKWLLNVAHVGDTRIYHVRGTRLNNLTEDQTELAELRRKGVLTEHQAKRYPRKHVLTSALSAKGNFEIFRKQANLQAADRIILLSDGVYEKVTRGAIVNLSIENDTVEGFAAALSELVEVLAPTDNFSAIAIQVEA